MTRKTPLARIGEGPTRNPACGRGELRRTGARPSWPAPCMQPIRSRSHGEGPTTMLTTATTQMTVCLRLTKAISRAQSLDDIYGAALDALAEGLGIARASILLFDPDGVMRFKAWRGLSQEYRRAVEGHTPWTPDAPE